MADEFDTGVDYKKMYHIMMNAAEQAIEILISAQHKCEEMYISPAQKDEAVHKQ